MDYSWDRWVYAGACRMRDDSLKEFSLDIAWTPDDPCIVNLPLYNGIKEFRLGIDARARVEALPSRKGGINKPVVFYGTSITHGACASRDMYTGDLEGTAEGCHPNDLGMESLAKAFAGAVRRALRLDGAN